MYILFYSCILPDLCRLGHTLVAVDWLLSSIGMYSVNTLDDYLLSQDNAKDCLPGSITTSSARALDDTGLLKNISHYWFSHSCMPTVPGLVEGAFSLG